jgi:hypothetical protein
VFQQNKVLIHNNVNSMKLNKIKNMQQKYKIKCSDIDKIITSTKIDDGGKAGL